MLGDQVYADEISPGTREFIRARRDPERAAGRGGGRLRGVHAPVPRGVGGADDPLAAVDRAERDDLGRPRRPRRLEHVADLGRGHRARAWWDERIEGAVMSYWSYQHLGNLAPERAEPRTRCTRGVRRRRRRHDAARVRLRRRPGDRRDALELLPRLRARPADDDRLAGGPGARPRAPVDGRHGRVALDRGARAAATATTCCSAPRCRSCWRPGMHELEAWNEAVCEGAWGRLAARLGEEMRQGARPRALGGVRRLLRAFVPARRRRRARASAGEPPATIVALSGDVHHAYLAEVGVPAGAASERVYQAVCSPFRNPLDEHERRGIRACWRAAGDALGAGARARRRRRRPAVRWRLATTRRGSTTRCASSSSRAARPASGCRRRAPTDNDGFSLEMVFEAQLA